MAYRLIPLLPPAAAAAAALHGALQLPESWNEEAFATLLAMPGVSGIFAFAEGEDGPAGLALWRIAADEAEILTIGVLPEGRRRGIGKLLLEDALAAMREGRARRVFLEVAADNAAAFALYLGLGFDPVGRRPGYYRTPNGPIDASILARNLY